MSPAKSPNISGFFATQTAIFSVPKHRCKIAVFPLWQDLNSRKVNIRYARQTEIKNLSAFFIGAFRRGNTPGSTVGKKKVLA